MDFAAAVIDARDRILKSPGRFPSVDSLHRECTLLRFPFGIIYRVHLNRIVVIAVAHAKRRPGYWQNRTSP